MKVAFMVEENSYFNSDMKYEIVERYRYDGEIYMAYDIYEVETDDFTKIRVVDESSDIEYVADTVEPAKRGNEIVYYVTVWTPVKEGAAV